MGKKVVEITTNGGRVIVGPDVSKRKGKDLGTDKGNRQSSQDKHRPVRPRRRRRPQ